jgi:signal transduction histidine kinase
MNESTLALVAGGVAHNVNNMLLIVLANSRLALTALERSGQPAPQELRTHLEAIVEAGEQAAAIVRQLLRMAREERALREVVDLNDVLRQLERLIRLVVGQDVELVLGVGTSAARVEVDRPQLEQAIMNLALNAREAMPSGGRLAVAVEPGAAVHRLSVADTGPGIEEELEGRIFEPYFTTKATGTGVGLSTVRDFAERHGGAVDVQTAPGHGSRFFIELPALR